MEEYNFSKTIDGKELRELRRQLGMTQKEFSELTGVSKVTVERWERSKERISGPIVLLANIIKDRPRVIADQKIPEKKMPLRLRYMFGDRCCTLIDVDEVERNVEIKNFTDRALFRAFGVNTEPTFEDYEDFLESRCFPRGRDKMKIQLEELGIPFYDPMLIIEKTKGRMAEDDFWIQIER